MRIKKTQLEHRVDLGHKQDLRMIITENPQDPPMSIADYCYYQTEKERI